MPNMDKDEDIALENLPIINNEVNGSVHQAEENKDEGAQDINANETGSDLTSEQLAHYKFLALLVAWLSVIFLLILGVLSFIAAQVCDSSAAFGFAFDCILDVFTSVVVIWRFTGSIGTLYSANRERMALLLLGVLFIAGSVSILVRSIPDLITRQIPKDNLWVVLLASIACLICFILAASKFYIAKKLNSVSIRSDGISSLAGGITCLSWGITAASIKYNPNLWFLDDTVGICVSILLLLYGFKLLYDVLCHPQVISAIKSMCNSNNNSER